MQVSDLNGSISGSGGVACGLEAIGSCEIIRLWGCGMVRLSGSGGVAWSEGLRLSGSGGVAWADHFALLTMHQY